MNYLIDFVVAFLVVFFAYYFIFIRRIKKALYRKEHPKAKPKRFFKNRPVKTLEELTPVEVKYLVARYQIDVKKISYLKLLVVIAFVDAFDIAIIFTVSNLVDGLLWQLGLMLILMIPIIMVSYHFIGIHYRKKGMKKNV